MKNYALSIGLFICVVVIFIFALGQLSQHAVTEGAVTLEKAITRASVQCYSIEGRYPSSVEYLVDHYGLQVDEDKYAVFYEGFASNIMPEISVSIK